MQEAHSCDLCISAADNVSAYPGFETCLESERKKEDCKLVQMDHYLLHKTIAKKKDAEANNKVKRRSLEQKQRRDLILERQRLLSPLKERTDRTDIQIGMKRKEQLKVWQEERKKKKEQDRRRAKPIFKVSAIGKRDVNLFSTSTEPQTFREAPARNTRSQTRTVRLETTNTTTKSGPNRPNLARKRAHTSKAASSASKIDRTQQNKENKKANELSSQAPTIATAEQESSDNIPLSESFAPHNFSFKAPTALKQCCFEFNSSNLNDVFVSNEDENGMNFFSSTPCVTKIVTKKKIPVPLVLSSDHGENVQYFRNLIVTENTNLMSNCNKWEQEQENKGLSEEVTGEIRTVVGQARLLMAERFVQFGGLIDKFENPKPDHNLITPADLKGFWEMIYYQVEDIAAKFKSLETFKEKNWHKEEETVKKVARKRKGTTKSIKRSSAQRLAARKRIKEAREAMSAKLEQQEDDRRGAGEELDIDDIESNENDGFAAKYLIPSCPGETELAGRSSVRRDNKFSFPSVADSLEEDPDSPMISDSRPLLKSPGRVLRSSRKSSHNPMSPFLPKPSNSKIQPEPAGQADDLMSFSLTTE